ncbi:MAG TPA: hypothetical protein VKH14_01095 [Candidatus Udaeobacter sp.]|nr:hypothetical protein [Candidatus Udaeobacter sp.]
MTVLIGVVFDFIEMRRARRNREERAASVHDAGMDEFVDDRAFDSKRHNCGATRE